MSTAEITNFLAKPFFANSAGNAIATDKGVEIKLHVSDLGDAAILADADTLITESKNYLLDPKNNLELPGTKISTPKIITLDLEGVTPKQRELEFFIIRSHNKLLPQITFHAKYVHSEVMKSLANSPLASLLNVNIIGEVQPLALDNTPKTSDEPTAIIADPKLILADMMELNQSGSIRTH